MPFNRKWWLPLKLSKSPSVITISRTAWIKYFYYHQKRFFTLTRSTLIKKNYSHVWCIVFFQLQDLAVTSGLRDPRLNFAESVIEGHIPDMKTTGRSYLRVVLWFSFLCPMFFGPFLYLWVLQYLKDDTQGISLSAGSDGNRRRVDYICRRNEEPLIWSVTLFCCFLLLIEVMFVLARVWTSTEISKRGNTVPLHAVASSSKNRLRRKRFASELPTTDWAFKCTYAYPSYWFQGNHELFKALTRIQIHRIISAPPTN